MNVRNQEGNTFLEVSSSVNGKKISKRKHAPYRRTEKNGDTLTPIMIFKRIQGEKKFLLESSFPHERKGRYSYIGADPYLEIIGRADETKVINRKTSEEKTYAMHALEYIATYLPNIQTDIPLPFTGGAIGYVGYDALRHFVDIGDDLPNDLDMPDLHFMVYDTIVAYEHRKEKLHIIAMNIEDEAERLLEEKINRIEKALETTSPIEAPDVEPLNFQAEIAPEDFIKKVERAKDYIAKGEVEQLVLSQRLVAELKGDPVSYYRKLRSKNPSPYMFYIDFGPYLVLGSSPESLIQTYGEKVITNPIAGTRPRGKTPEEDEAFKAELLSDQKERKEHDMLLALSKEEIAPICEEGSLEVPVYREVVRYEHVMHLVSEVHGKLKADATAIDALLRCLPAGTVSGTPKKRAMQLINELESLRRGVYAGGIGFISFSHDVNLAITIRSLLIKDGRAYIQAGAGIVADSIPEEEYAETLHKARSLLEM